MPAGHDFDALLIGALYGELSAVEESRLQAHLAAHPADQQIFRDLTRTREAIRAGVAAAFVEPPQAISALLLQEAARRAPRHSAESGAASEGGRWMRWISSLLAHPGLAAAAMAVLVVGVFGTMYLRGESKFAESTAPSSGEMAAPSTVATAPMADGSGAAAEPGTGVGDLSKLSVADELARREYATRPAAAPAPEELRAGVEQRTADSAPAADPSTGGDRDGNEKAQPDSYSVGLSESGGLRGGDGRVQRNDDAKAVKAPARRPGYLEAKAADDIELKDYDDANLRQQEERQATRPEPAKEAANGPVAAKPMAPKTPESKSDASSPPKRETSEEAAVTLSGAVDRAEDEQAPAKNRAKKGGSTFDYDKSVKPTESAAPPPPTVTLKTAPPKPVTPSAAPTGASGKGSTSAAATRSRSAVADAPSAGAVVAPGPTSTPPAATSAPSPTSSPVARDGTVATAQKQIYDDSWAKSEHVRLVRLARASKCSEAATVARVLSERAPRYYQDQVANDRALRVCSAAIRDQLNLQSEQAKRKLSAPARANEADAATPSKK